LEKSPAQAGNENGIADVTPLDGVVSTVWALNGQNSPNVLQ